VIIDMSPPSVVQKFGRPAILADWNDVQQTKAVRNHRVYIFDQTFAYVPGPRFLQFVEYLARELHPEINWDKE
jgi:ABC-type Fe3+-hydroxamate transport system substrate-binding protein